MKVTRFTAQNSGNPSVNFPKPERVLIGNPKRETWNAVEAPIKAAQLFTGTWRCEPGMWKIAFSETEHEVFTVHSGRCRVHDESGNVVDLSAGDSLHIPPNFVGAFEVLETVTKTYTIIE
jgi:uncharacterized protein